MEKEISTTIIHAVAGLIMGYLSFVISTPLLAAGASLVVMGLTMLATKTALKIEEDSLTMV